MFNDGTRRSWSGSSPKPRIACHIDACDSLWSMGVRSDQLVGYYDSNGVDGNSECHGTHCSDVHLETMVNLDLGWKIDMEAARSLNIDIFVDVAYCYKDEQCYKDADSYAGWLKYYNLAEIGQLNAAMITINLRGKSFLEVIDQYQRLAIAVGDKPNVDLVNHCHEMHAAMESMIPVARKMETDGIRVTTAYVSEAPGTLYLAQPTDDPVTLMLEELGVPMTHVNVNDHRGGYWEHMDFPDANTVWRSANKDYTYTVKGVYPTDVWLYDVRRHGDHMLVVDPATEFNDPAWVAKQRAVWPIDTTYTYERATRILNSLRHTFSKAKRVATPSTCTPVDVTARAGLGGGQWACHNPKPTFPTCPSRSPSPPPATDSTMDVGSKSTDDNKGMEDGAVAGIAIGCAVVGFVLGALVLVLVKGKSKGASSASTKIEKPDDGVSM